MERYEKALFDAFVWTQAVEDIVRDLILEYVDQGVLNLDHENCTKLENLEFTLGWLLKKLKPCVEDKHYERLQELKKIRNDIVHRTRYVESVLRAVRLPDHCEADIGRFQEATGHAQATYRILLHLFREAAQ